MPSQRFVISADDAGSRLDVFLARSLSVGRSTVRRLIETGLVRVDGRALRSGGKSLKLAVGAVVEVDPGASAEVLSEPGAPLEVLASGAGWLIANKAAGVPVHPLRPGERGTLLNAVVARYPEIVGVGEGGQRSGVVHRLDVDTSGAVLFATRQDDWVRYREAITSRRARKVYRAIAAGRLSGTGELTLDLVVAQHRPARVRVVRPGEPASPDTRRCDLRWRAVESLADATLVEVDLGTGFLHQIRVMMAHVGHALVGDPLYAPPAVAGRAPRQMLHAAYLKVDEARAQAPDPEDFLAILRELRPTISP